MKMLKALLLCLMLLLSPAVAEQEVEYPEGTLYRGVEGRREEVEFLQYQLFYAGYLGDDISAVDGIFGKQTESAVIAFQKDHKIDPTGIVCPNTQNALDDEWEKSMEPQGGEEEPMPYCYTEHYANGTETIVLCTKHMEVYARAAEENNGHGSDVMTIEGLQAGLDIWMAEVEHSYQQWMLLRPEYAQLIGDHQAAFMNYYQAQLALWCAHYGSDSVEVLNKAQKMLADHCSELCIILSGVL